MSQTLEVKIATTFVEIIEAIRNEVAEYQEGMTAKQVGQLVVRLTEVAEISASFVGKLGQKTSNLPGGNPCRETFP